MQTTGLQAIQLPVDLPAAEAALPAGSTLMDALSGAIEAVSIDRTTLANFLGRATLVTESAMMVENLNFSIKAFNRLMDGAPGALGNGLGTVAHGLNAMSLLDKVTGNTVGVGSYRNLTRGLVQASRMVSGVQEGNMIKVAVSGFLLCAALVRTGNQVADMILTVAEDSYTSAVE